MFQHISPMISGDVKKKCSTSSISPLLIRLPLMGRAPHEQSTWWYVLSINTAFHT